jgi:hypothetical protein
VIEALVSDFGGVLTLPLMAAMQPNEPMCHIRTLRSEDFPPFYERSDDRGGAEGLPRRLVV